LDGSSGNPGWLASDRNFYLAADTMYTITFSLAGNNAPGGQASSTDRVAFGFVSATSPLHLWEVNWNAPFETVSCDFPGTGQTESLLFGSDKDRYDAFGARDYAGPKIDNIVLTAHTPCIPVPGAALLSGFGVALSVLCRRRRIL
jgi:hypothetical protein